MSIKNNTELNLSKSLFNYCSFGVFEPNYFSVSRHKGKRKPKEVLYNDESDNSETLVNNYGDGNYN
jgi:hypothetical protein